MHRRFNFPRLQSGVDKDLLKVLNDLHSILINSLVGGGEVTLSSGSRRRA